MSNVDITEDIKLDEKIKKITLEPSKYKVVMLNDDQTPMEWVIEILKTIFKHSQQNRFCEKVV